MRGGEECNMAGRRGTDDRVGSTNNWWRVVM